MTRKHYIALAGALRLNLPQPGTDAYAAESLLFTSIVNAIARACSAENPRFCHDRFERACGLKEGSLT
jgi:hypothetical protein